MAINNLANTKWQFNNEPALSDLGTFAVNFTSNNTDYTSLTVTAERMKYGDDLAYGEPEPVYPVKGDLITMNVDGTDRRYRVLKSVSGSVYEVLGLFSSSNSAVFSTSGKNYEGGILDTHFNTTWYGGLTETAKAAIVDKTFAQDSWNMNNSGDPDYIGSNNGSAYTVSLASSSFGNQITRHVYALGLQDVLDYLETTPQMTVSNTTLTSNNLQGFFENLGVWLRSACAVAGNTVICIPAYGYSIDYGYGYTTLKAMPAFQIDLSKIDFSIST